MGESGVGSSHPGVSVKRLIKLPSNPAPLTGVLVSQPVASCPCCPPGIHPMVGLGAPGGLGIGSSLEDPIPCAWSRIRLPSDWGRRGTGELAASCSWNSCHHGNREPGLLCEQRKGSSFSGGIRGTSLLGPPASWPEQGWGLTG